MKSWGPHAMALTDQEKVFATGGGKWTRKQKVLAVIVLDCIV